MQLVQVNLPRCLFLTTYELLLSWLFFLLFLSIAKFCDLNVLVNMGIESVPLRVEKILQLLKLNKLFKKPSWSFWIIHRHKLKKRFSTEFSEMHPSNRTATIQHIDL